MYLYNATALAIAATSVGLVATPSAIVARADPPPQIPVTFCPEANQAGACTSVMVQPTLDINNVLCAPVTLPGNTVKSVNMPADIAQNWECELHDRDNCGRPEKGHRLEIAAWTSLGGKHAASNNDLATAKMQHDYVADFTNSIISVFCRAKEPNLDTDSPTFVAVVISVANHRYLTMGYK
ncbi:hypothetical protein BDV95DRAFT_599050 [Massariosphaeria phaeospora]|uniref:Uncharacterized protein n=1 Tax=Massariosphaeria phaeospora TaxID=100035 RepID=A0A7C8M3G2_9PLEO|nr:hypothetical protein BDV95DRAFT_599050 [Massariosphaeria phaeospora]